MRTKTAQFAFLWVVLILCWGASPVTAQTPVTRPSISEQVSPVEEISIQAQDGYDVIGVVRKPPGSGPFPAVVVVHGGFYTSTLNQLRNQALNNPTTTRFLAAGYVTMIPTFRSRAEDPQTVNALWDNLAIVAHVKQMAQVDPNSVVVYGCSGGGDLALELAGEADLAAITAEEPATVLFTGIINQDIRNPDALFRNPDALQDLDRLYTPDLQRFTQEKIRKIGSPIFIAQGDQPLQPGVDHHKIVNEILVPELKAAGKEVEEIVYPGQRHCFGFSGLRGGAEAASRFFTDMDAFFKRHLPTQPRAVDDSLIEHVAIEPAPERVAITVSSEILADYVGTYELLLPGFAGFDLVLTLEDDQLMGEAPGFGKFQWFAESETNFWRDGVFAEFVRGDDGIVTHLIVTMFGVTSTAPRKSNDG